jgi:Methyltransferase domain
LMQERLYVQYGCGWSAPRGWRNFDASPTLRFERLPILGRLYTKNEGRFPENVEYGDVVRGLPVEENACDGVYCSHVLEHLALSDFRLALKNTHKILRSNATFRLVLPDLLICAQKYVNSPSPDASMSFLREACLGEESRPRSLRGFLTSWLGNSRHLWMWDFKSIVPELQEAGFVDIRRAAFGDSSDPMFASVEEKDRWDECLGVECRKP